MSINKLLLFPLIMLIFMACGNGASDNASGQDGTTPTLPTATTPPPTTTPTAKPPEPAQNADGVWHYTCPKGCAGGGGSAIACASCGTTLAHNQAYHGNPATPPTPNVTTTSSSGGVTSPVFTDPSKQPVATPNSSLTVPPKKNEPPQNASGVWHYTCPAGCAGGGGSAIACSKCGKTLAHNQAYHN